MGPAPNSGIDHTPGKEDFTENRIHESQTSTRRCWTFNFCTSNSYCFVRKIKIWVKLSSTQLRKVSNFGAEKWDGRRFVIWGVEFGGYLIWGLKRGRCWNSTCGRKGWYRTRALTDHRIYMKYLYIYLTG